MTTLIMFTALQVLALQSDAQDTASDASRVAQQTEITTPRPWHAEVSNDHVNVRSGPSTNYYAVMRLNQGQRLVVHEVKHSWAKITPPNGSFSLIHKDYVDLDGDTKGIVNGNHVWVRCGSTLSDQRYVKQVKLSKGQAVERLSGEIEDYYRIVPPNDAYLWISAEYITKVEETELSSGDSEVGAGLNEAAAQPAPPAPSTEDLSSDASKNDIEEIEALLEAEFEKAPLDRDLDGLIEQFETLANRSSDPAAQKYAEFRVQQLQRAKQRVEALKEIDALGEELRMARKGFERARTEIRPPMLQIERGFDVKGRLLKSYAYQDQVGPRRYRMVDPNNPVSRTIAYVEFSPDSTIDPESFIGRYVGVRAHGRKLIEGAVDSVVVYTVAELVLLEQATESSRQDSDE